MTNSISLEPLADYLEPRFGNIYDGDFDESERQQWTGDLKRAVKCYLLREDSKRLSERAFGPRSESENLDEWAEAIIKDYEPWEVAYALRRTVVVSLPSLGALIGDLQAWPSQEERCDATHWLEENATRSQLVHAAMASRNDQLVQRAHQSDLAFDLPQMLAPHVLLGTWNDVVGWAPSDLADAEWELISPFIPVGGPHASGGARLDRARSAINGMLYRYSAGGILSRLPPRYGTRQAIYLRYRSYRRNGVFARMLEALRDQPEAARLVEWLQQQVP